MKAIKQFLYATCILAFTVACSNDMKEMIEPVVPNSSSVVTEDLQYMEFTVSPGADTRTELTSDNAVVWQSGDSISIFDGTGNRKFTTKESGESVVFSGYAKAADTYYALYPYQANATIEGNVIKGVIAPSIQTATAGSFDASANLSVAQASSDLMLAFKNVGSLVKFSVSNEQASKVRSVKVTSHSAGAVLAGTMDIIVSAQPPVSVNADQQLAVTLTSANGLAKGTNYFVAVLPGTTNSDLTLTFIDNEGKAWEKTYTDMSAPQRAKIMNLDPIEVGEFTDVVLTNANLIAAAEASSGKSFEKNADGSVSVYNSTNSQIIDATTYLNVEDKHDPTVCDEIGLFPNLEILCCIGNEIVSLDMSGNLKLKQLYCYGTWDDTLSNYVGLKTLDVSKNTALTDLSCGRNQLTSIDVSNNTALTRLWCQENQLASIDVSKNTALEVLQCNNNQLTSLNVSNNTALTYLNCYGNQLTSLDVSNNTALTTLWCDSNQLTSLDVSKNTALTELYCYSNQLTSLDVSNNTALTTLWCHFNQLTSLDVSNNTALTGISCSKNQLTSLDVSKNTALTTLWCSHNQLTSLDVSKNTALTYLNCYGNQLTSLDVSNNTALTELWCQDNQLANLDLPNNTALTELRCYSNQLTSLDVSKNTALTYLYCSDNQLTSLDVSANTQLILGEDNDGNPQCKVGNQHNALGEDKVLDLYVNEKQIQETLSNVSGNNKNVNVLLKP